MLSMGETVNQKFIRLIKEFQKSDIQFVIIDPAEEYKQVEKRKKIYRINHYGKFDKTI